jgi:ribulose-phosphate 3-epimerase
MQIIPTTNPQVDFNRVEARLSQFKDLTTWIQIDVTDGILVKPVSFPLELLNRSDLILEKNIFDIHLMVKEPINWLNKCLFIQASRVTGQVESMTNRDAFIAAIKDQGLEAGLAFDINTSLDFNIPIDTDLVLLMGRPMGFDPLPLDDRIFTKIKKLKDKKFKVAVDGGVTPQNLPRFISAGVDIIYSGQYFLDLINATNY